MKTIRAKMVENLLEIMDDHFPDRGYINDHAFISLCDRIAGNEVTLVFIDNDAFELKDYNYWLPGFTWMEV